VPAIAGGIGALLADCDGGIESRNGVFGSGAFDRAGAGVPGPGDGFGLAWPG
jgi:hypothetical protein